MVLNAQRARSPGRGRGYGRGAYFDGGNKRAFSALVVFAAFSALLCIAVAMDEIAQCLDSAWQNTGERLVLAVYIGTAAFAMIHAYEVRQLLYFV